MSQIPPPQPPSAYDSTVPYSSVPPKTSGMALTAMILGICAIPFGCLGVGVILGIIAIILGVVALSSINRNPQALSGKGYAITGIATGAGSLPFAALLIAILLPSMGKARELPNRSVCAANIRGITQSLAVYAKDNNDQYPIISPTGGYGLAAVGSGTPGPDADKVIESMYTPSTAPSVAQNMWLLVLTGQVAPKQFLCKSDPATTVTAVANAAGAYQTNFNDGAKPSDFAYSYSFAYPWTTTTPTKIGGWWMDTTDAGLPLMADMAPSGGATTTTTPTSKNANSFTHQRDGQNIGFGDSHAEFARRPDAGQSGDNIYTFNAGTPSPAGTAFTGGKAPGIANGGVPGAYDICLVPVADSTANYTRK